MRSSLTPKVQLRVASCIAWDGGGENQLATDGFTRPVGSASGRFRRQRAWHAIRFRNGRAAIAVLWTAEMRAGCSLASASDPPGL